MYINTSWAERELELFANSKNKKPDSFTNVKTRISNSCDIALEAYKLILNKVVQYDDINMGVAYTKDILIKLLDCKILTPIEDNEEDWMSYLKSSLLDYELFCSNRYSSLYKRVYKDGSIKYFDIDRVKCVDLIDLDYKYSIDIVIDMIDELYPITMPYIPPDKPFEIYCQTWLYNKPCDGEIIVSGCYDTIGIYYGTTPEGEHIGIFRYFKFNYADDHTREVKEITHEEYHDRMTTCKNREEK